MSKIEVNSLVNTIYSPEDTLQILNEFLNPFPKLVYSDLLDKVLQEDLPLYVELMFGTKTVRDTRYSRLVGGIETAWLISLMYYNGYEEAPNKEELSQRDYDKSAKVFGEPELEGKEENQPMPLKMPPFSYPLFFTKNDIIKVINKAKGSAKHKNSNPLSYMSEITIDELISEGESEELEFKQSLRWGSSDKAEIKKAQFIIMKTIAGFANADGGTLLIGVTDAGEAVGLESDYESLNGDKDEFELHLGNLIDACFGKVFRANNIKMKFPVINDNEFCQIDIKPNKTAIVLDSINKSGQKIEKFYLRSGNQTAELSMAEASEYIESQFESN